MLQSEITRQGTATAERRSETRWPSGEPSVVTILESETSFDASLIDVSNAGLRLRMDSPLDLHEGVRVMYRNLELYGEVRWCRHVQENQHEVGIHVKVKLG